MSAREFDPRKLDVEVFAKESAELNGHWPLRQFERVMDGAPTGASVDHHVAWSARGERRLLRGGESQTWLHVKAEVAVPLICQRCLGSVVVPVAAERSFLFVHGEEAAAQLDDEIEDDVLPMARSLDLQVLVEDEVLLALPLVPRHDACPVPLVVPGEVESADDEPPHPFAALAALKPRGPLN